MSDTPFLPVRCLSGRWQVLFNEPSFKEWVQVDSEREARLLSRAQNRWENTLDGHLRGAVISAELFATAEAIERRIGSCMAHRICRRAAKKALE